MAENQNDDNMQKNDENDTYKFFKFYFFKIKN